MSPGHISCAGSFFAGASVSVFPENPTLHTTTERPKCKYTSFLYLGYKTSPTRSQEGCQLESVKM